MQKRSDRLNLSSVCLVAHSFYACSKSNKCFAFSAAVFSLMGKKKQIRKQQQQQKTTTLVHTVILLFAFSTVIFALLYSSIAFVKAFNKLKMSSSSTTQAEALISVYSTLHSAYILHKYTSVVELLLSYITTDFLSQMCWHRDCFVFPQSIKRFPHNIESTVYYIISTQ